MLTTKDTGRAMHRLRCVYPHLDTNHGLRDEFQALIHGYRAVLEPEDLARAIDAFTRGGTYPELARLSDELKAARRGKGRLDTDDDGYLAARWCGCTTGLMPGIPGYTYCPEHNVSTPAVSAP